MFLQSYIYQAAGVIEAAHISPEKLFAADDRSRSVNPAAIRYGNLELKAMLRRYLHFALPCMAYDLWARGLKTSTPTAELVQKKTGDSILGISALCYRSRVIGANEVDDIIASNFVDGNLTAAEAGMLRWFFDKLSISSSTIKNIPFYDDGHGYNFFYDNTPYDASRNLLLSEAEAQAKADPSRSVPIPNVSELFSQDDFFVIDQFRETPNSCLGPSGDSSILKKIKLLMGPEYVMDVGLTSVKELKEMGLWHPTEFEQLIMSDGLTVSGSLKAMFGTQVSALIAMYWHWLDKVSAPDAPMNTKQWIRKELSDGIEPEGVYYLTLDKCTLDWIVQNGIAQIAHVGPDEVFTFPKFDRNRYAARKESERGQTLQEWAWALDNTVKFNKSTGVKLIGLAHPKYVPIEDESSMTPEERDAWVGMETLTSSGTGSGVTPRLTRSRGEALSMRARQFLEWAQTTTAQVEDFIDSTQEAREQGTSQNPEPKQTAPAPTGTVTSTTLDSGAQKSTDISTEKTQSSVQSMTVAAKGSSVSHMDLS